MKFLKYIKFRIDYFLLNWKFKKNYGHKQAPIICGEKQRQLGKTTMIIKEAAKRKLPIIVDNQMMKHHIIEMALKLDLNIVCVCPSDNLKGTGYRFFLFDGNYDTYIYCITNGLVIMNGFLFMDKKERGCHA